MKGKVYLVGGGPGDLGLMTRKAFALIQQADCLVYDRLIDNRILLETKVDCECIYVGKANRNHTMKQEDINQLLVDKAKENKLVVRLKGGDVYVFGRGGEEGLVLKENNVPFEVVPGISSSIAGLAYAGIPITHRGVATGFHVVTAHNKKDELADIDFEAMARSEDTCVFLMGLSKLNEIVEHLLEAGKRKDSKVAVISNATLPKQDVVIGTLETIADEVKKHPLPSPALIVVGEVVSLREHLNFFENRPLFRKRILLPRVGEDTSRLSEVLREKGAFVQELAVSKLIENKDALDQVNYLKYNYIVFTSRHACDYFMNSLRKNKVDVRTLSHIKMAAVGSATKLHLEKYGIYADIVPETYYSDAVLELLKQEVKKEDHVLIPCVKGVAYKWEELKQYCSVETIDLYENVALHNEEMKDALTENWDYAVFTCSSAVENTFALGNVNAKQIISIGKMTSATLKEKGVEDIIQSDKANYDALIETIMRL